MTPDQWEWLVRAVAEIKRELAEAVKRSVKEWYTVEEFAAKIPRRPFTIRQHCNGGRLNAEKCDTRCGRSFEWRLSHAELERYLRHGLLPRRKTGRREAA